ncbi:unnamed protein product [Pieris macdunnoughi]|uniref:Uncharacterized protein n=1 Tax=Pieris macdunnoughi TaxID=345717 RepID=A0A821X3T4_9NEOP|nr:unnamed protein product [Pieris macdunnoughi]
MIISVLVARARGSAQLAATFRRPSESVRSERLSEKRAAPASAVNELTLTNAPFGIVRGKTGGLAHTARRCSTNRGPSRHSLRPFWRESLPAFSVWRECRSASACHGFSVTF